MRITDETWIVVADGDRALFLKNTGDAGAPRFRALRRRKPGHVEQAILKLSHDKCAETLMPTWEEGFARSLADDLNTLGHQGAFDRLVICASHDILSEVRRTLHKDVRDRVIADVPTVAPQERAKRTPTIDHQADERIGV